MPDGVKTDGLCFRRFINLGFDVTSQPSLRPGQLGFVTAQEQISSFVGRDGAATSDFTAFGFPNFPGSEPQIGQENVAFDIDHKHWLAPWSASCSSHEQQANPQQP